ncbi:DUF4350 domain-containing protein [Arenicella xantha]|uniref:Trehalose utilization protein n=1 Tax=Arenicella xantha TaxID=644221 RepID=A0A395JJY5_9GAMM|nr:DUF4350 domain-containing protein [Arenicella xantha]RBP49108.1 hypothetical protein DFR28_10434 [Arenicella xantha]
MGNPYLPVGSLSMLLSNSFLRQHLVTFFAIFTLFWLTAVPAAQVVYIHGGVSDEGIVLDEGQGEAYDPMLLSDSGPKGLSEFKATIEAAGHSISSVRDKDTQLSASLLSDIDVLVFGLHQKIWSSSEKAVLDTWLRDGGGMLIYSDSAAGGNYREVGAQNPRGQTVTNNLISAYGMQVTVDQADGVKLSNVAATSSIQSIANKVLEGEGVSPVAIADGDSLVEILVPYTGTVSKRQGLTISDPVFAALVLRPIGAGHIVVMFDRQPMWNGGPGSDIDRQDNRLILNEVIGFLAQPVTTPTPTPTGPIGQSGLPVPSVIHFLISDDE